jgi:hypothetical protein
MFRKGGEREMYVETGARAAHAALGVAADVDVGDCRGIWVAGWGGLGGGL